MMTKTGFSTLFTLILIKMTNSISYKDEILTENSVIKFYVYDDLNWYKMCAKDKNNKIQEHKKSPKYGAEIEFLEQIENHPWRTQNAEEANVFIIPVMWSYSQSNCHENTIQIK